VLTNGRRRLACISLAPFSGDSSGARAGLDASAGAPPKSEGGASHQVGGAVAGGATAVGSAPNGGASRMEGSVVGGTAAPAAFSRPAAGVRKEVAIADASAWAEMGADGEEADPAGGAAGAAGGDASLFNAFEAKRKAEAQRAAERAAEEARVARAAEETAALRAAAAEEARAEREAREAEEARKEEEVRNKAEAAKQAAREAERAELQAAAAAPKVDLTENLGVMAGAYGSSRNLQDAEFAEEDDDLDL